MPVPQRDLPGLTVVRFFAAIAVVLYHFADTQSKSWPQWAQNIVHNGHIGVSFFFILSGFILVYVSHGRNMTYREFIVRRIARIYPVYLLAWLVFWAVHTHQTIGLPFTYWLKTSLVIGGASLALVQSWFPGLATWNGPSWTLSCEAFFYAMFPLALIWIGRLRYRSVWIFLAALLATVALVWAVCVSFADIKILAGTPFETSLEIYLEKLPLIQFLVFLIGMVAGHIFLKSKPLPHARWVAWSTCALIAIMLSRPWPHDALRFVRGELIFGLFIVLIYSLASYEVKAHRIWVVLGQASYGMYILQMPVWAAFWLTLGRETTAKVGLDLIIYIVVLIAASIASFLYFEKPAEKWIKKRFIEPRRASSATADTARSH